MNFDKFIKNYEQFNILKDENIKISEILSLSSSFLSVVEDYFKEKKLFNEIGFDIKERLFLDFGILFVEQVRREQLKSMISFEQSKVDSDRKFESLSYYIERLLKEKIKDEHPYVLAYETYKKFYGLSRLISKRDRTPFLILSKLSMNIPKKYKVKETFEYIENLDKKVYDNRFFKRYGKPNVLFVPGMGNGIYDSSDNLFVLPINIPRNYEDYISPVFISYRWQLDSDWEFRSSYMTLPSYSKLNSKKLMQKMISDYKDWLFKEKKGYKVLTKEVREWISWQIAKEPIKKHKISRPVKSQKTDSVQEELDETMSAEKDINEMIQKKQIKKLKPKEVLNIVKEGFASGEDLIAVSNYYWDTLQQLLLIHKKHGKLDLKQKKFINFGLTYNIDLPYPNTTMPISNFVFITFTDYIFKDLEKSMDFEIADRIVILRRIMELSAKRDRVVYCPIMFKGQNLVNLNETISIMSELIDKDQRLSKYRKVRKSGLPKILLAPGRANGFYFWESEVFVLPIIPVRSTQESVYSMYALFKWDNDEDIRTEYKMLKDVVKMNSLNSQRSFIKDVTLWFSREEKGYKVLTKEKKKFFERFFARKETL